MASRGKKKNNSESVSDIVRKENSNKIDALLKNKRKSDLVFNLVFAGVLIVMFLMIIAVPVIHIDLKVSLDDILGQYTDGESTNVGDLNATMNMTLLDILLIPTSQYDDTLDYIVHNLNYKFLIIQPTEIMYRAIKNAIQLYYNSEDIKVIEMAFDVAFAIALLIVISFVTLLISFIINCAKKPGRLVLSNITGSIFVVMSFVLAIIVQIANTSSSNKDMVSLHVAGWILLLGSIAFEIYLVLYTVKERRITQKIELLKCDEKL